MSLLILKNAVNNFHFKFEVTNNIIESQHNVCMYNIVTYFKINLL